MSIWGIIFIIAGIILTIAIYQNGMEGLKATPAESVLGSAKTIVNAGKNVVGYAQGTNESIVKIGMIPCKINEDCSILNECINSTCLCYTDGFCYRRE